jgi:hypothetical protein
MFETHINLMSSRGPSSILLKGLIALEEPAPKRVRREQKTRDQQLAERKARKESRRLPGIGRNATADEFIAWIKEHYTREPLADDEAQLIHWNAQTCEQNQRTFLHADDTFTPAYHSLQSGGTRATAMSDEEQQLAKIEMIQKIRLTRSGRELGQMNWLECAAFKAFVKFIQELGYIMVGFERMPDCVIVDFCAVMTSQSGSIYAPVQVKVARGLPGTQVHFNVNEADGAAGGRYEDHILICLLVSVPDEDNLNVQKFDELPDVDILEAYIMKSSDMKCDFCPTVYDHKPGSKRGRANAYDEFRYIVGHDKPDKLDKLMRSLESNIQEIWSKRKWTRDHCFFKFGKGSPNTKVSNTQETELRGMKAVSEALVPFKAQSPLRHNETVDILFCNSSSASSVRISLKTASYHHLNKDTGNFSSFRFQLGKAPNSDHCDVVVAVQFDLTDKTKVVVAYVFDSKDVYKTDRTIFRWHKSAHTDRLFDMTHDTGCHAFKEHVASFMKTDKERSAQETPVVIETGDDDLGVK